MTCFVFALARLYSGLVGGVRYRLTWSMLHARGAWRRHRHCVRRTLGRRRVVLGGHSQWRLRNQRDLEKAPALRA
ncbi:hypothetical protein F5J12DRAFT_852498, partial [Pisolithus orientalis]|uniref:uncharacterized protein n=1 Tax=Pisolithus orientalis TaxID=936130 RepID=UPI0022250CF9